MNVGSDGTRGHPSRIGATLVYKWVGRCHKDGSSSIVQCFSDGHPFDGGLALSGREYNESWL